MTRTASKEQRYIKRFFKHLPESRGAELRSRSILSSCSKTRATLLTQNGTQPFDIQDFHKFTESQRLKHTALLIENIDLTWIAALGIAWAVRPRFFAQHALPLPKTSPLSAAVEAASARDRVGQQKLPEIHWHVDGIFEYSKATLPISDPNYLSRRIEKSESHGWQAASRFSGYWLRDFEYDPFDSFYVLLVDAPPATQQCEEKRQIACDLRFFYGSHSGIPIRHTRQRHDQSLYEALRHIHTLDPLLSRYEPFLGFYKLATTSWNGNLQSLDHDIKEVSFRDLRRPSALVNDRLHDLRGDLITLQAEVALTKNECPHDPWSSQYERQRNLGALEVLLDDCKTLERLLMDTFNLLVSSTSVMEAQASMEQAKRGQRLTQLAFIYVPLSFVTGVFGMNIKDINDSPQSASVVAITLVVTAVCTAAIFGVIMQWDRIVKRAREVKVNGWSLPERLKSFNNTLKSVAQKSKVIS